MEQNLKHKQSRFIPNFVWMEMKRRTTWSAMAEGIVSLVKRMISSQTRFIFVFHRIASRRSEFSHFPIYVYWRLSIAGAEIASQESLMIDNFMLFAGLMGNYSWPLMDVRGMRHCAVDGIPLRPIAGAV